MFLKEQIKDIINFIIKAEEGRTLNEKEGAVVGWRREQWLGGEGKCRHDKQRGKCRKCRSEGEAAGGEGRGREGMEQQRRKKRASSRV